MIILVSSQTKTFDESIVKVDEKRYVTGETYYDITYTHKDVMEASVLKNQMTEIMVNYLLSEPDELVKVSGTSAEHYRHLIMMNLSNLSN
jgi:hypothetical protein